MLVDLKDFLEGQPERPARAVYEIVVESYTWEEAAQRNSVSRRDISTVMEKLREEFSDG